MEKQKNILIIGSSSEIAQAIIEKIAYKQYNLITTTRTGEGANYVLDLANQESVTKFETEASKTSFEWVLYCAGFIEAQESTETFEGEYGAKSRLINFSSAIRILNTLIPNIQKGGGVIVLSSTAGIWGNALFPIYSTWKGALNIFIQTLQKKLINEGKYAFSTCLGPTNTRMRQSLVGDALEHQSPANVAEHIATIIEEPEKYKDFSILIIRNSTQYALEQKLHPIL